MRTLGLVTIAAMLPLAACAKDPDGATGSAGSGGPGGSGGGAGGYTPPALKLAHPNPIISRGKTVASMPAGGAVLVDGTYHNGGWAAGTPTDAAPAWAAIKLDPGPTRILVSWDDGGTYHYQPPVGNTDPTYGLPAAYHLEVSADSSNGSDGTWTTAAGSAVTDNQVRTRAHSIDFTGKTWVKMVITASFARNASGVRIGEIDVHDISATGAALPEDTWFFMGDSITAFAYARTQIPSFARGVNLSSAAYFPAMINGGVGGENTAGALARLDEVLANNPAYRFFAITYGTNDGWGNSNTGPFRTNLQAMIDKIKAAGRVPVLTHVPFAADANHGSLGSFNAVVDELTRSNQLQIGPDFYAYFMQHPDELSDLVHPNDAGQKAMNQLWADAMRVVYP
jgi:acyl-CoA thioesterase I